MRDRYTHYVLVQLILANVLFVSACFSVVGSDPIPSNFKQQLSFQTSKGRVKFLVDIADTLPKQSLGLMHQKSLAEQNAMLFVFNETDYHSIWMKNTYIPLDVIFFDENLTIVAIVTHTTPFSLKAFNGHKKSRFVLEMRAGLAEKFELAIGQQAILE